MTTKLNCSNPPWAFRTNISPMRLKYLNSRPQAEDCRRGSMQQQRPQQKRRQQPHTVRETSEKCFLDRYFHSPRRQKKIPPPRQTTTRMTDKQRAQWAREHYQQHYGKTHNQPTTTPTLPNWTPQILGYTNRPHDHCDQTLPITPPNFEDMCEYLERPLPQNVVKI